MFQRRLVFSSLLILCSFHYCSADDWNLWRGPHCDGAVSASGYFSEQSFGMDVLWKNNIGSAYSAVSIVDQRVLTMFNDGKLDYLGSIDLKTGKEVWRYRVGNIYKAHDGGHDGPVSTPVADHQQVYALGPRGRLFAVEAKSGKEIWSVQLSKKYRAQTPFWGFATTPILFKDLVIVQANGARGHGMIAFSKKTGEYRWHCAVGRAEYRSPVLVKVDDRFQIIASSSSQTIGVDPGTGKILWRYGYGIGYDKSPVYVGDRKILLTNRGGCVLIELNDDHSSAKQVWRSSEFRGNYDVPSAYDGCIFGFTGRYLTCVDVKSGRRIWRSRQPGGKGLIIVEGHIVVLGDHGDVVVAKATRTGYVEKSRINVSDGAAYSWPAFADETIVVRNLKHLVALRPNRSKAVVAQKQPPSRFAEFVKRVEVASDKTKLVDEFLGKQKSFPIIEDEKFVHFVYRGRATDVGIRGTMLAGGEQDSMLRIAGTDFYYRTYKIEPGANWEYQFIVNYDRVIPDPKNPRRTFDDSRVSELLTKSWSEPAFAKPYRDQAKGRVESVRVGSSSFSTTVSVYLPHNFRRDSKHSLVVVLGGREWISDGKLPNTLNHILKSRRHTPVVAIIDRSNNRELGGGRTKRYSQSLAEVLVPELAKKYGIDGEQPTTIIGRRGGAVTAVYAALRYPSTFDNCVAISYGRADTVRADAIADLIKSSEGKKAKFHIAWNRYEVWRPQSFDCREQSQQLSDALKKKGYTVTGGQDKTGFGWRSWRAQVGNAFLQILK